MVDYLSGGRIQGSTALITTPPQTSWKEIGRTTLGSSGATIDVTSLPAKDNLMILMSGGRSSGNDVSYRYNADTNDNYAGKETYNGQSDNDYNDQNHNRVFGGGAINFDVQHISNKSNNEKLMIGHGCHASTGANNVPTRVERTQKWANTSSSISQVNLFNLSAGNFDSGAEVVVLGMDNDESDSGTNFWQELTTTEATSNQSGTWSTDTFTSKKYLWVQCFFVGEDQDPNMRVGTGGSLDTGNNYSYRFMYSGTSDQTDNTKSSMPIGSVYSNVGMTNTFIFNQSDKEKLFVHHALRNDTAGADNSPAYRFESAGKWANTSGQIDKIGWYKSSGTIAGTGSWIKVWGSD
jgi:hypothetical protein